MKAKAKSIEWILKGNVNYGYVGKNSYFRIHEIVKDSIHPLAGQFAMYCIFPENNRLTIKTLKQAKLKAKEILQSIVDEITEDSK